MTGSNIIILFIITLVCTIGVAATPSIYLDSPNNGAGFLLKKGITTQSIPLEYQLFGIDSNDKYELCFEVFSVTEGMKKVVDVTCVPSEYNRLTIQDLIEGQYQLHGWLKSLVLGIDFSQTTKIINTFHIYSYASAVPNIELHPQNGASINEKGIINLVADAQKGIAELSLGYSYSQSLLDHAFFTLCAYIYDLNTQNKRMKLPLTCLNAKDRQLVLNNLASGESLEVHLLLRDIRYNDREEGLITGSEIVRIVNVMELSKALPILTIQDPHQEYLQDPLTHMATVQISFQFQGASSAIKQIVTCITIERTHGHAETTSKSVVVPYSCLPSTNNIISLQNMKRGEYKASMILARADKPSEVKYLESVQEFTISIRPPVEFIPSYDWQPLHVWHTIPSGIETRLPIGYGARKEARIPEPWRLQLPMPAPCKYFLRMDVNRHTHLSEISEKASEKCKNYPANCFKLSVAGTIVDDVEMSVETSNLFAQDKELLFDENCLQIHSEAVEH